MVRRSGGRLGARCPRRTVRKNSNPPRWHLEIGLSGNGGHPMQKRTIRAFKVDYAKAVALKLLKKFLGKLVVFEDEELRVEAKLRCVEENGRRIYPDAFELRPRCTQTWNILQAKDPSRVFRAVEARA